MFWMKHFWWPSFRTHCRSVWMCSFVWLCAKNENILPSKCKCICMRIVHLYTFLLNCRISRDFLLQMVSATLFWWDNKRKPFKSIEYYILFHYIDSKWNRFLFINAICRGVDSQRKFNRFLEYLPKCICLFLAYFAWEPTHRF